MLYVCLQLRQFQFTVCGTIPQTKFILVLNIMQYAGDITSLQAWKLLSSDTLAILVDVRTEAEMNFVGTPSVDRSQYLSCPIYELPNMQFVPEFISRLQVAVAPESKLLFLCRSGGRSRDAAVMATEYGFNECYNIADGFEGTLDQNNHRGTTSGWKASNLPWGQN